MMNGDDPKIKDSIFAELYGQIKADLENRGLTDGKEFKGTVQRFFDSSRRYVHVYDKDNNKKYQLVVFFNSAQMKIMYGIADKEKKKTIEKYELDNLRYKISTGEDQELIDAHKEKWTEFRSQILNSLVKVEELNKLKTGSDANA